MDLVDVTENKIKIKLMDSLLTIKSQTVVSLLCVRKTAVQLKLFHSKCKR